MIDIDTIYNEDCLEGMKRISDSSIDCIICDLPYGTTTCTWDSIIPFEPLWAQYKRIRKPKAPIVLFCAEPFTSALIMSNVKEFREKLTWEKHKPSNFANAKRMHLRYSEDIVVFSNGPCTYNPQMQPRTSDRLREMQKGNSKKWNTFRTENEVSFGGRYEPKSWKDFDADWKYPGNVLRFPSVVSNSKEKCDHPTQKPVALLFYLIKTYSNPGDLILDNCMGSGSTAVACIRERRHFIGFELDKKYFDIAIKRIGEERKSAEENLF